MGPQKNNNLEFQCKKRIMRGIPKIHNENQMMKENSKTRNYKKKVMIRNQEIIMVLGKYYRKSYNRGVPTED